MIKTYHVRKVDKPITVNADWDKPVWQGIDSLSVALAMGQTPQHRPITQAKLVWDDDHIYAIFRVEDRYVRAVALEHQGKVCRDSCVEFFFTPKAEPAGGYFNIETNCIGTMLMCHQRARQVERCPVDLESMHSITLKTSFTAGRALEPELSEPVVWTLEWALPWRLLEYYTQVCPPGRGVVWRGNFYKCADGTSHPHWLTWSEIPLDTPDFHQPEYFGFLQFTDNQNRDG